jgi:two-component system chemotaxis response regulator CheB
VAPITANGRHPVVVIGASAGGVQALTGIVGELPEDFPAAIAVVLHLPPSGTSVLAAILDRAGPLPAVTATDGLELVGGRVHVAPVDHDLIVVGGALRLSREEAGHRPRPSVDTLFATAARSHGAGVVGVVLSGTLHDGARGLEAIAEAGGVTVVQDPRDAIYDGMPTSALARARVDHVCPVADLAGLLARLVASDAPAGRRHEECLSA